MKTKYLLQIGLAFTLLYASISALITPQNWIGYIPDWAAGKPFDKELLLQIHAIVEIILAVLLLINFKVRIVAALVALEMLAIIAINGFGSIFLTTFRDVGLFFTALFLALDKSQNQPLQKPSSGVN